jgi:RIO kinase 3
MSTSATSIISNNNLNKTSPWAKLAPVNAPSLTDVMSEQLAKEIHDKEELACIMQYDKIDANVDLIQGDFLMPESDDDQVGSKNLEKDATLESDFMLAQLLQLEFDKEHDQMLKGEENIRNRNSKGNVANDF